MFFKSLLQEVFVQERKILKQLEFVFCSDAYLLNVNQNFLSHDYYTDIITFDLGEGNNQIFGEVYISIDRVRENAHLNSVKFLHELSRVMIHGALHLSGYADKKKREITLMRQKEDHYLRLFEKAYQ